MPVHPVHPLSTSHADCHFIKWLRAVKYVSRSHQASLFCSIPTTRTHHTLHPFQLVQNLSSLATRLTPCQTWPQGCARHRAAAARTREAVRRALGTPAAWPPTVYSLPLHDKQAPRSGNEPLGNEVRRVPDVRTPSTASGGGKAAVAMVRTLPLHCLLLSEPTLSLCGVSSR